MAHAGQEIALRLVGRIRCLLGSAECKLSLFQLRHIFQAGEHAADLSVVARNGRAVHHERAFFGVVVNQSDHHAGQRRLVAQRRFPGKLQLLRRRRNGPREIRGTAAHQPLRRFAHDIGKRLVGQHDTEVLVQHEQAFRQRIECGADAARHDLGRVYMLQRLS